VAEPTEKVFPIGVNFCAIAVEFTSIPSRCC
jgi:hypothetical protein